MTRTDLIDCQESIEQLRRNVVRMEKKPRVLVVEDDDNDGALVQAKIERQCVPCEIEIVKSCEAAIDRLRQGGIDFMFLDLAFPGMSGIDLLKAIPDIIEHLPVIALSGREEADKLLRSALDFGVTGIFSKDKLSDQQMKAICGMLST